MSNQISIIVDSKDMGKKSPDYETKSARNSFLKKKVTSTIDFEVDTIKDSIGSTCKAIMESLGSIDDENFKFEIEKASFNLVFDTNGKVSILSSISGEMNVQTGITITLQPKN